MGSEEKKKEEDKECESNSAELRTDVRWCKAWVIKKKTILPVLDYLGQKINIERARQKKMKEK